MKQKLVLLVTGLMCYLSTIAQIKEVKNVDGKTIGWNIISNSGVYKITLTDKGEVVPIFFGPKAGAEQIASQGRSRGNGPFQLNEVPVRGSFADKIPIVEVVFADNTRDCELVFEKAAIVKIDNREVLKIQQRDKFYPLMVTSYIRVLPEYNLFEKWIEVKNEGRKGAIKIENLMSGSILLPSNTYYLTHHGGRWLNEFMLQQTRLTSGIKTLQAKDFTSFNNTRWFAISDVEDNKDMHANVWFGQVHYSGNWRLDFESTISGHLQVAGGINFWDTEWMLDPGKSFTTPKLSVGFTSKGVDEVSRLYAAYINNEILRPSMRERIRPIIYNSWYATGFNVNEENQLALARQAKDIGVELFVIDDGWFTNRNDDTAGLGDWQVDEKKFPNGLNSLISKINDMGMDFGIWVESEMINAKSELYAKHPDWVLYFPTRTKNEWRHQLTLNLAREDVYTYLLNTITNLLKNHNIKFVKWDRNRGLSEPGWPSEPLYLQKELRIRYVNNLYRLIDEIEKRFPNVLFESCSSGGGRPDLGMLSKMDQTWTSDNTNPLDRLYIQYGYLSAYPAKTMVCWTTGYDRSSINLLPEFIFDVAMQGVLGVGDNIQRWDEQRKAIAKQKIEQYKSIRHLIQNGDLYRLHSPFQENRVALEYVSKDKKEGVTLCYNLHNQMEGVGNQFANSKKLLLKGLDPGLMYQLDDKNKTTASGAYLMSVGIPWTLSNPYRSLVLRFKAK